MKMNWIFWTVLIGDIGALSINSWENGVGNSFNLLVLSNLVLLLLFQKNFSRILTEFMAIIDPQNKRVKNSKIAIKRYLSETSVFTKEAKMALTNINYIGQQNFSELIQNVKNADIHSALVAANKKIIDLRKKEKENNWITEGIATIAELKQNGNEVNEYAYQAISSVIKYLNANQGGFFLLKEEDNEIYFELSASYAYGKKKFWNKRINLGDGLIGQAYYEKEITYITDVPADYIKITSGLGEALPRCICIVPLMYEGQIFGVIEIASFTIFKPSELEYLKKIADNIGYNLGAIANNKRTEMLLKESQTMAQEVKSQEEELRQNMEELSATQEQMRRKETEVDAVLNSLSTVELDVDGKVLTANSIFLGITGFKLQDIEGKLYKSIIPQNGNDSIQYEMMWSSIMSGRSFSGEFRIVNRAGKEMWMAGNFTPLLNDHGAPYKVMVISLFTTQDKEKLLELQEMVAAFKNCFPIAELNQDMTFKAANDLFLNELGIKRLELRKSIPKNILVNGSFGKLEQWMLNEIELTDKVGQMEVEIKNTNGTSRRFHSSLVKINKNDNRKGLLILRNSV